ncbi:hypothetical protein Vafri_1165, partial [Volvox africanus]
FVPNGTTASWNSRSLPWSVTQFTQDTIHNQNPRLHGTLQQIITKSTKMPQLQNSRRVRPTISSARNVAFVSRRTTRACSACLQRSCVCATDGHILFRPRKPGSSPPLLSLSPLYESPT